MKVFELVNPVIKGNGTLITQYTTQSPIEAAQLIWNNLSSVITNDVPLFYFTLKDENDKLHHFSVEEMTDKNDNEVKYNITEMNMNINKENTDKFINYINALKKQIIQSQEGGRKKRYQDDDDDDDFDDDEDDEDEYIYKRLQAIRNINKRRSDAILSYWWYYPNFYNICSTGCPPKFVYIPTFNVPLTPYIEIYTDKLFEWTF